jgi:hypothetical protein
MTAQTCVGCMMVMITMSRRRRLGKIIIDEKK